MAPQASFERGDVARIYANGQEEREGVRKRGRAEKKSNPYHNNIDKNKNNFSCVVCCVLYADSSIHVFKTSRSKLHLLHIRDRP